MSKPGGSMRLGEILISVGLLTPEQLARGLESQSQYGGRLGTNLVELGYITERQLAGTLSEQLGLPYVSAEMVGSISPSLIARVPLDVATEFRVFPITLKARALHVCMCDPTNVEKLQALTFRLSCSVQPCVVTELTLNQTLERYYGLRREPRFLPLKPASTANATIVQIAEQHPGASSGERMSRGDFLSTESGEFFHGGGNQPSEIGPALAEARTEANVVESIRSFLASVFGQSLILSLSSAGLMPIAETGLGLDSKLLASIVIPMREDSVLGGAMRDLNLHFHWTATDPTLLLLCQKTGMDIHQMTVIPVMHQRNLRFLLLGHGLDMPGLKKHLPAIKRALNQCSCALQIVSLRRQLLDGGSPCDGPCKAAV